MVDDHNPNHPESQPLNTELETLAPEPTAEHTELSSESTPTQQHETENVSSAGTTESHASSQESQVDILVASAEDEEPNYDAADFAAALANFDREQAAESAAAQNLTTEEVIVTGTVIKITDKHVVVDIGLKSEGLIPLDQVLDANGVSKFQAGDTVEVVVEREEAEGGYLVSYDKAMRHKVWDTLEQASIDKTPVKMLPSSRVASVTDFFAFWSSSSSSLRLITTLPRFLFSLMTRTSISVPI